MRKYLISFKYEGVFNEVLEGIDIFETDKNIKDVTIGEIVEWCKDDVSDRRPSGGKFYIYKIDEIDEYVKKMINNEESD